MEKKIIYCGNVESTVNLKGNQEILNVVWTVPNIMNSVNFLGFNTQEIQPSKQEVYSSLTGTSSEDNFQFYIVLMKAMRPENRYQSDTVIDIGYKSKTPAFLRICLLRMFTFNLNTWTYSEEEQTIFFEERVKVVENTRHVIGRLWNNDQKSMGFQVIDKPDIVCLLSENSLRLYFEFTITTNIKVFCNIPASQLSEDWEKLFHDGLYSDAIITSSEGEEFKVHKLVLASRCAVLKAHFEHNTTETKTNIVKTNLKSAVLREVLSFIYTDRAEVDKDPQTLLEAADFYQLSRLKGFCEDSLRKKLTVTNAWEILRLADFHNANTLKKITQDFIKRNNVQQK